MKTLLRILPLLVACCAAPLTDGAEQPSPAAVRLVALMGERLAVSREVAWTKYEKQIPVRDAKREKELLAAVVRKGEAFGLPETGVRPFFIAQILASCALQDQLMTEWKSGKPLPKQPAQDLVTVIRPKLDRITGEMLDLMKVLGPDLHSPALKSYAKATLEKAGYSEGVAAIASSPLR